MWPLLCYSCKYIIIQTQRQALFGKSHSSSYAKKILHHNQLVMGSIQFSKKTLKLRFHLFSGKVDLRRYWLLFNVFSGHKALQRFLYIFGTEIFGIERSWWIHVNIEKRFRCMKSIKCWCLFKSWTYSFYVSSDLSNKKIMIGNANSWISHQLRDNPLLRPKKEKLEWSFFQILFSTESNPQLTNVTCQIRLFIYKFLLT